jgi:hypothetical protein
VLVALQKPTGKDGRVFAGGESTGKDGFCRLSLPRIKRARTDGVVHQAQGAVCTENLKPYVMVMKSTKDRV